MDFSKGNAFNDNQSFFTKVAGVTFENRQIYVQKCYAGQPLELVRDKFNPYDKSAIAVYAGNHQVGFLSKELAAKLAPQMDDGVVFACEVSQVTGGNDRVYGLNIKISRIVASGSACAPDIAESTSYGDDDYEDQLDDDDMFDDGETFWLEINDISELTGRGIAVGGTIAQGKVTVGDELCIKRQSGDITDVLEVSAIVNVSEKKLVDRAFEGDYTRVLLKGTTKKEEISRGDILFAKCSNDDEILDKLSEAIKAFHVNQSDETWIPLLKEIIWAFASNKTVYVPVLYGYEEPLDIGTLYPSDYSCQVYVVYTHEQLIEKWGEEPVVEGTHIEEIGFQELVNRLWALKGVRTNIGYIGGLLFNPVQLPPCSSPYTLVLKTEVFDKICWYL